MTQENMAAAGPAPVDALTGDARDLYRRLVRGDRTFTVNPPRFADDIMPENWEELDAMLEDHLEKHRDRGKPDAATLAAAEALREYINRMSPPPEDE